MIKFSKFIRHYFILLCYITYVMIFVFSIKNLIISNSFCFNILGSNAEIDKKVILNNCSVIDRVVIFNKSINDINNETYIIIPQISIILSIILFSLFSFVFSISYEVILFYCSHQKTIFKSVWILPYLVSDDFSKRAMKFPERDEKNTRYPQTFWAAFTWYLPDIHLSENIAKLRIKYWETDNKYKIDYEKKQKEKIKALENLFKHLLKNPIMDETDPKKQMIDILDAYLFYKIMIFLSCYFCLAICFSYIFSKLLYNGFLANLSNMLISTALILILLSESFQFNYFFILLSTLLFFFIYKLNIKEKHINVSLLTFSMLIIYFQIRMNIYTLCINNLFEIAYDYPGKGDKCVQNPFVNYNELFKRINPISISILKTMKINYNCNIRNGVENNKSGVDILLETLIEIQDTQIHQNKQIYDMYRNTILFAQNNFDNTQEKDKNAYYLNENLDQNIRGFDHFSKFLFYRVQQSLREYLSQIVVKSAHVTATSKFAGLFFKV